MRATFISALMFCGFLVVGADAEDTRPLTPVEAIKKVNEKVVVEMQVKATKNRLEKRGEIYLDSEEDFRDKKNLGIVVTKTGAAKFKEAGVDDPAVHFKDKTLHAINSPALAPRRPRTGRAAGSCSGAA